MKKVCKYISDVCYALAIGNFAIIMMYGGPDWDVVLAIVCSVGFVGLMSQNHYKMSK